MFVIHLREPIFIICFLVILVIINGCAGTAPPLGDANTASGFILDARESFALAISEEAPELAPREFAQAQNLLAAAQEALEKGRSQEAGDLAFQADMEVKIATAMARETKAKRRGAEIQESKPRILWDTRTDELAAARTWQAIAERKALAAQEEARQAQAQADRQIERSKAELAIAKAELEIDLAKQFKASAYAEEAYNGAISAIQTANSALAIDDFQKAITAAATALKNASNAFVQARAKSEVELEESLRGRDRAVAAMAKAEMAMAEAKESLKGQYAEDMYTKAEALLGEARQALETRVYDQAESLAEKVLVYASNAMAVAEAEERETLVREALEDARANALDALAKAERSITEAREAGAEEHAGDTYKKADAVLQIARQAIQDEDFESAVKLAQESFSHSVTALTMAEAKTEHLRKLEAIESKIMEEAGKIPDTTVRKTNTGVVISMGGDLFAQGSSQMSNEAKVKLKAVADILKIYPEYKVVIEGHTDNLGSDDANLEISRGRANNFLMYMVDNEGIPLERISSVGYGESRPIASNINEDGRRQNRRVDIVILTAPVSP